MSHCAARGEKLSANHFHIERSYLSDLAGRVKLVEAEKASDNKQTRKGSSTTRSISKSSKPKISQGELSELVLNHIHSGVIFCDESLNVVFFNEIFADLFDLDKTRITGKPVTDFMPNPLLQYVLRHGKAEMGVRYSVEKVQCVVNIIPVKKRGEVIGIIVESIPDDTLKNLIGKLSVLEDKACAYKREFSRLFSAKYTFSDIKGESGPIREARMLSSKYAKTDSSVLLLGATGTGKEMFAHAIHNESWRRNGPFVCLNCAAIPKDLFESELFGYAPGAFTGAHQKGKVGKIELAQRGTVFLDEIGDLPLNVQSKLLRVLESKTIERVGDLKPIEIDFRLIAATNKNLRAMIGRNEFREDLFYRLNTMTVQIPKLCKISEDIPLITNYILSSMGKSGMTFSPNALEVMQRYEWIGNIRELKNVIERAVSLADSDVIDVEHLPPEVITLKRQVHFSGFSGAADNLLTQQLFHCETEILKEALRLTKGNKMKTAKLLGISRSTLYEKCEKHNLSHFDWNSNC